MVNEVLCKLICHNLCCLVQEQCELGIETEFWGDDAESVAQDAIEVQNREPDAAEDLAAACDWV